MTTTTTRYCEAVVIRETRQDPAEYCENEALEDSDYCEGHTDHSDEYEPDDYAYEYPDENSWGL